MASDNSVDMVGQLMQEHNALVALLPESEISLRLSADAAFRKTLLLSAASYFEVSMSETIINAFSEATNHSEALVEFVRVMAVDRRYHGWFNWDVKNANRFFGAFGSGFRTFMEDRIKGSSTLEESIKAFMEMGSLRNQLVHQNFASFPLDKTVAEIFDMYQKALGFIDAFPDDIGEFLRA